MTTCRWAWCESPATDGHWCADHAARLTSQADLDVEEAQQS